MSGTALKNKVILFKKIHKKGGEWMLK